MGLAWIGIGGRNASEYALVEQFPVSEIFLKKNMLNRGIGLDTTVAVLKRVSNNLNNINISNCFLLIGHNDLKYRSPGETHRNIELILLGIKAKKKYFISILPCADSNYNIAIRQVIEMVKFSSGKSNFIYIDVYHLFAEENNKLKCEYFYDGVHLNIFGYLKLKEVLQNYISE